MLKIGLKEVKGIFCRVFWTVDWIGFVQRVEEKNNFPFPQQRTLKGVRVN